MSDLGDSRPVSVPGSDAGTVRTEPLPSPPGTATQPPRRGPVLLAALVAAVVATLVAVPLTLALSDAEPAEPAAAPVGEAPVGDAPVGDAPAGAAETDIAAIAEALLPSVARVDVAGPRGQGSGSAVVYTADGYLLTNEHVVRDAAEVQVTLPDGTSVPAEVVGVDAFHDLAVLRVDAAALPTGALPVPAFADQPPRIGETAIAIGSPFELDGSVTAGIVSGLGRAVPGTPLRDLVQTDAPINPGNSGGALVNGRGEVIGINTAIIGPPSPGGQAGNVGIGFAIPITNARPVADQLIEQGFVQHAQLGVQAQDVDPGIAEVYGLEVREGALVLSVAQGSAAEAAGLQRGDIITRLDDDEVTGVLDLVGAIRAHAPGDDVEVEFVRAGERMTVTATLGAAEEGQ